MRKLHLWDATKQSSLPCAPEQVVPTAVSPAAAASSTLRRAGASGFGQFGPKTKNVGLTRQRRDLQSIVKGRGWSQIWGGSLDGAVWASDSTGFASCNGVYSA